MTPDVASQGLEAFLAYEFKYTDESLDRLAIAKIGDNKRQTLVIANKNILYENVKFSLEKVVNYIQNHQEEWHQEPKFKVQVERQCAWLQRKVEEHNSKFLNKKISYENPFKWNINVKMTCALQDVVSSNEINFIADRLTSENDVFEKYEDLFNQKIKIKFGTDHKGSITASKLFEKFSQIETKIVRGSIVKFIADDEDGKERALTIKAKDVRERILDKLRRDTRPGGGGSGLSSDFGSSITFTSF